MLLILCLLNHHSLTLVARQGFSCGTCCSETSPGEQLLAALQLQVWGAGHAGVSLECLVRNGSMTKVRLLAFCGACFWGCPQPTCMQAEELRQLLCRVLQDVVLGPGNCLSLLSFAQRTGLPRLFRAAAAMARQSFPLCAVADPEGLAATSEVAIWYLLQRAERKVRASRQYWRQPCLFTKNLF